MHGDLAGSSHRAPADGRCDRQAHRVFPPTAGRNPQQEVDHCDNADNKPWVMDWDIQYEMVILAVFE